MELESILLEYGKSKQLGKLELDSSGVCTLLVNNHLVTFEKSLDREGFFVYSSIGTIPVGKEQEISLMVLKGNLFNKETGQANIGYIELTRTLVLFEYFEKNTLDYTRFLQRFDQYIQHLFYWIVKLESPENLREQENVPERDTNNKKIFYV
jgi:hypothetical protein